MAQFLRPNGDNYTNNILGGGWADIDEVSPNDADYVTTLPFNGSGQNAIYNAQLTDPSGPFDKTAVVVRYRASRSSLNRNVTLWVSLYEGGDLVAADPSARTLSTTFTTYEWIVDLSAVGNFNNLLFVFSFQAGTGASSSAGRLSWGELELPGLPASGMMLMF